MSTNGQYIAVTGLSRYDPVYPYNDAPVYFRIAISSNYGASFADYTSPSSYVVGSVAGYCLYPISVSGNGQYITAVFGYNEYQGAPYNYQRPSTILFKSNNYGASWTQDIFNNALFQGIALSGTGQYQFVTGYWSKRFIVGPAEIGIKGYISNDYGANWTQKFEDYNSNIGGINYNNLSLVGISDNGSYNFYNLSGNKYLTVVANFSNTANTYDMNISDVVIQGGYQENDNNSQFLFTIFRNL
jgi:hypothetical protein